MADLPSILLPAAGRHHGPVGRLWHAVLSRGVRQELPLTEQRKIRISNESAAIAVVSCLAFAAGYAVAGLQTFWPGTALNVVAALILATPILLNARGRHTAARLVFLGACHLHILLVARLLGPGAGFQYWAFILIAVAFLILSPRDRVHGGLFPALSMALFVYATYLAPAAGWIPISVASARALNALSFLVSATTLAAVLSLFDRAALTAEEELAHEYARSERLLLNVLPASISLRLKHGAEVIADRFEETTVLFADLVGFTVLSERLPPEELTAMLNRIFSRFDDLCLHHGLEKIKTIGDAYMAASGLPEPRPDHAQVVIEVALEMQRSLAEIATEVGHPLALRIGVDTGPVIAGVIGKRKFIYDLWGDTVNTASRMESHGVPGQIQITDAVRRRLGDTFAVVERGRVQVKGKGEMVTYFVQQG